MDDENDLELEEDLYTQACDYFLQLFCTQPAFANDEALERTLGIATSCDDKTILEMLEGALIQTWATLGISTDKPSLRIIATTPKILNLQLKKFTESSSRGKEALWPLVQIVRTYFDCPFLKQGLVVADCPGMTDSNQDRRGGSLDYLADCTAVIVTGAVDRVCDQRSVKEYVIEYARLKTGSNIFVVLTKIDIVEGRSHDLTEAEEQKLDSLEEAANDAIDTAQAMDKAYKKARGGAKLKCLDKLNAAAKNSALANQRLRLSLIHI